MNTAMGVLTYESRKSNKWFRGSWDYNQLKFETGTKTTTPHPNTTIHPFIDSNHQNAARQISPVSVYITMSSPTKLQVLRNVIFRGPSRTK